MNFIDLISWLKETSAMGEADLHCDGPHEHFLFQFFSVLWPGKENTKQHLLMDLVGVVSAQKRFAINLSSEFSHVWQSVVVGVIFGTGIIREKVD